MKKTAVLSLLICTFANQVQSEELEYVLLPMWDDPIGSKSISVSYSYNSIVDYSSDLVLDDDGDIFAELGTNTNSTQRLNADFSIKVHENFWLNAGISGSTLSSSTTIAGDKVFDFEDRSLDSISAGFDYIGSFEEYPVDYSIGFTQKFGLGSFSGVNNSNIAGNVSVRHYPVISTFSLSQSFTDGRPVSGSVSYDMQISANRNFQILFGVDAYGETLTDFDDIYGSFGFGFRSGKSLQHNLEISTGLNNKNSWEFSYGIRYSF